MKRFLSLVLVGAAFLSPLLPARAQDASPAPTVSANLPLIPPNADPATATRAWLDTVPADKRAKSNAYFEGGYWLLLWDFLLSVAICLFFLKSRLSARLRDWAESMTRFKAMQVLLYAIPYLLITAALTFPLTVYEQFFREHEYGLATQTFGAWFGDQLKALLIVLIAVPILLIILYAIFRKAPRTWWIWGACVMVAASLFAAFISPVFVEPLFNKYTALEDPAIRLPILALARANQIPTDKVLVVDASRQTTRVSANVAGFLGTTRIALNDNLLKQCSLPEIRQVMGHEMGHYVLNHGFKIALYTGILFLIGFALTRFVFDAMVRKHGSAWGVRGIGDPAGLPLLALIVSAYTFLATPLFNTAIRTCEAEADIFSLNTARAPDGMAQVALKLGTYRKLDPTPLEEFIFFDHPSGRARIRMAMDWKAANLPCGEVGSTTP